MSIGEPPDVLALGFGIIGMPGLTIVGGIAGFMNLSEVRLPACAM